MNGNGEVDTLDCHIALADDYICNEDEDALGYMIEDSEALSTQLYQPEKTRTRQFNLSINSSLKYIYEHKINVNMFYSSKRDLVDINKYLAKVCSDLDKPKGFSVLGKNEAHFFLKDKPVNLLWGVGSKFKTKLNSDGIINIGQIQKMEEKELIKRYGAMGLHISQLSKGKDSRAVKANRQIKSISHEITFSKNIKNKKELEDILVNLSQKIAFRAKSSELGGKTINLKL